MWAFLLTPLSFSKPRKLLCGGKSFSSCIFHLVSLFFHYGKILPAALDDALSYLIPFRAYEGWARPHSCPSSSMCLAATGTDRASLAGVLPAQGQQLTQTFKASFRAKKRLFHPAEVHCFAILEPGVQCVASFHSGPHLPEEARN